MYVQSQRGAWHVAVRDLGEGQRVLTECGLALKSRQIVFTLEGVEEPRVRPCQSCLWPQGYPAWRRYRGTSHWYVGP